MAKNFSNISLTDAWMLLNDEKWKENPSHPMCVLDHGKSKTDLIFGPLFRPNTHGRYRYAGSIFGSSLRLGFKVQNVAWINNTIKVWLSDPIGKQLHILIVWWQCVCIKRDKTLTLTHTNTLEDLWPSIHECWTMYNWSTCTFCSFLQIFTNAIESNILYNPVLL